MMGDRFKIRLKTNKMFPAKSLMYLFTHKSPHNEVYRKLPILLFCFGHGCEHNVLHYDQELKI